MRRITTILLILAGTLVLTNSFVSCSSIDCSINTRTSCVFSLAGDTLTDTLTISTTRRDGSDTVLVNRQTGITVFSVPMSYDGTTDELLFDRKYADTSSTLDTVTIEKDNTPHFEAVDCNPAFFHTLKSVSTTHHGIDSLSILNPNVTFDNSHANIQIFFKKH